MARLIFAIFALVLVGQAAAARSFSREELGAWVQRYYASPAPADVADAIAAMRQENALAQPGTAPPSIGFLSAVFARHPDRVTSWLGDLSRFSATEQRSLIQAVWLSGTPESRTVLAALGPEKLVAMFKRDLSQVPPPVADLIVVRSPSDVDFLWGRFFGSGSITPIRTIIAALALKNVKRETSPGKFDAIPPLTGAAAQWSLTANAIQDERVLDICRGEIATATGDVLDLFKAVVAKVDERRKPRA
jgi:hypothetical protein